MSGFDYDLDPPIDEFAEDRNSEAIEIFNNQALLDAVASLPPVPPHPEDDDTFIDSMLERFDGESLEEHYEPSPDAVEAWSMAKIFAQDWGDPPLAEPKPPAHVPAPDDVFPWPGSPKMGEKVQYDPVLSPDKEKES